MTDISPQLAHRFLLVNGIRMHVVEAAQGEPVLFLHGFPESWYSWRHQLNALFDDYHVIAPDLRGFHETTAARPYDTATVERDLLGLLGALGLESAHIVGHDWGGAIAYLLALHHPQAVCSLVICNAPHPEPFRRALRRPRQALRSWYMLAFQLPWLPERLLAANRYRSLARSIIRDCRSGTFDRDDVRFMLESWRSTGLHGGLEWYRALRTRPPVLPSPPLVRVPTTVIWGDRDRALSNSLNDGLDELVPGVQVHVLRGVSHWVQQDAPGAVTRLIREHLGRVAG